MIFKCWTVYEKFGLLKNRYDIPAKMLSAFDFIIDVIALKLLGNILYSYIRIFIFYFVIFLFDCSVSGKCWTQSMA